MLAHFFFYFEHVNFSAQFHFHARNAFVYNATRHDMIEHGEVGVDIER